MVWETERSVYWLSFALSRFTYLSSRIKLILLIGRPISASPSVYITSPDGFTEHKAKVMNGGTHPGFAKDWPRSLQKHYKKLLILALLFSDTKNRIEIGNCRETWEVIILSELIKSLSKSPSLWIWTLIYLVPMTWMHPTANAKEFFS